MSDAAPLRLITAKEPWPELVEHLKNLLSRAEAGELSAFAFVGENFDGTMVRYAYHGSGSYPIKMVGQLDVLKLAVIHRHCKFEDE